MTVVLAEIARFHYCIVPGMGGVAKVFSELFSSREWLKISGISFPAGLPIAEWLHSLLLANSAPHSKPGNGYLRWLEKHEMQSGEEPPIGLILCADKGEEQIELLQLDKSGIRVASYLTELPPRPLLQKKLHDAYHLAQASLQPRLPAVADLQAAEAPATTKSPPKPKPRQS